MKASFEPPKLSVWPFLAGDAALLAAAYWISTSTEGVPSEARVWSVVVCVGLGTVAGGLPLVVNYARRQELYLAERQREIEALAATTATSAEQLGVAVQGLQHLVEVAQKCTRQVEQLPVRLQDKVNEFRAQLNEVSVSENEALTQELNALRSAETERLEGLVDRIQKVATEAAGQQERALQAWRSVGEALAAQAAKAVVAPVAPAPVSSASPVPVAPVVLAPPESAADPVSAPASAEGSAPSVAPLRSAPPPSVPERLGYAAPEAAPAEEPKLEPKRRAGRRETDEGQADLGLELPGGESSLHVSLSADGRTRVVATAYIGIGNQLFVRGVGPGLSTERGVPLHFVSIGKWRWETEEATSAVELSFWKNDHVPARNLPTARVEAGQQIDVRLEF